MYWWTLYIPVSSDFKLTIKLARIGCSHYSIFDTSVQRRVSTMYNLTNRLNYLQAMDTS